jgi:hypothetical protein
MMLLYPPLSHLSPSAENVASHIKASGWDEKTVYKKRRAAKAQCENSAAYN